jgi:hypothetical protein
MPNSTIVRISGKATETLRELARKSGEPMINVIDRAIEEYRRRVFLEETNRAYAKLRSDKKASGEFDREMAAWADTLMDGLDRSETWEENGPRTSKRKGSRK